MTAEMVASSKASLIPACIASFSASLSCSSSNFHDAQDIHLHPSHTQALIYKYVPIIGPIFGSAFIIGMYMLSRLVKGDLTDRMNMMSQVGVCAAVFC